MNKFFWLTLFLFASAQSQGQTYTLRFFEHYNKAGQHKKDTFVIRFNKKFIMFEYSQKKTVNKIILDIKRAKQYIIWDSKKVIFYSDTIKQDTTRNYINALSQITEIDTFYFGFKSKFHYDILTGEDSFGNADTIIQKTIYAYNWPFNPQNYFVIINVLGFFSHPQGYPVYRYSKSSTTGDFKSEESESGIYKIEKNNKKPKFSSIRLPKNYTYKKLTHENIEELLLNK